MRNLNIIKWLVGLAEGKPIVFSVAILLIASNIMGFVIINRDKKIDNLQSEIKIQARRYEDKIDSITRVKDVQILSLTTEFKQILMSNISDAKDALKRQEDLNLRLNTTITKTRTLIKKNKAKLKK